MTSIGDNSNLDELGGMSSEQNPQRESMEREDSIEIADSGETADSIDLEEATLEPAALIEAQQEYGQAEAIEAALTELVDASPAQDANAPATEEVAAGWSTSGDADDRPTEEVTSGIEGETQGEIHAGLGTDSKPIPAEEGVLDLDGKGGDIAEDPVVKLELEEGVIPRMAAEEGIVLGGIDTMESGGGLVDFKFFKVEGQAGQEGSLIAKDNAYLEGIQASQSMEAALGRAVIDPAFRQELLDDTSGALAEYDLSGEEVALLGQIDPDGLQQVANQIKAQFENLDDPAAQTVLGRIITDVLSGGSGVVKGE